MLVVTVSGMNDQSGGFIDHHQVLVFIYDRQGDILRRDGVVMGFMIQQHLDDITRFDAIVRGNRRTVHPYIPGIGGRLDPITTGIGHVLREVLVHAFLALTLIYFASPALPQLILLYV